MCAPLFVGGNEALGNWLAAQMRALCALITERAQKGVRHFPAILKRDERAARRPTAYPSTNGAPPLQGPSRL
jgi:hypothetical protein